MSTLVGIDSFRAQGVPDDFATGRDSWQRRSL